ncbi:hypothetical protein F5984_13750 [Rudanella paleaurantiibacter]|uniref:Uncharacterized protein n=1 Tax=Rudanella paleaurantiibacter TaxID=2614655 RepID=A0A7J5TYM8_9BACT|nr:CFI-box-CTERM domain-containing protein [Rudanella paleaurantiibacter]KAB7730232.1 hypothetical protein F5984_13750 [Rudanella paleaurantiibacter]
MNIIQDLIQKQLYTTDFKYVVALVLSEDQKEKYTYSEIVDLFKLADLPNMAVVEQDKKTFYNTIGKTLSSVVYDGTINQTYQEFHRYNLLDQYSQVVIDMISEIKAFDESQFLGLWKVTKNTLTTSAVNDFLESLTGFSARVIEFQLIQVEKEIGAKKMGVVMEMLNSPSPKQKSSKSGCYIATFAYGDVNAIEVNKFREFRDTKLLRTDLGSLFVNFYYKFSPLFVKVISKIPHSQRVSRYILDSILRKL